MTACTFTPGTKGTGVFPPVDSNYKSILVISDLHMTDKRALNGTTIPDSPQYNNIPFSGFRENKAKMLEFIDWVIENKDWISEIVINGDLFDEWAVPMQLNVIDSYQNENTFVKAIASANQDIIQGFKDIFQEGIKITSIPGNHDMGVTKEDYQEIFGDSVNYVTTYDKAASIEDTKGLGTYYPQSFAKKSQTDNSSSQEKTLFDDITGIIAIEHGHRYDFWNCPDLYSNRSASNLELCDGNQVDGITNETILPIGFYVNRMIVSQNLKGNYSSSRSIANMDLYVTNEDSVYTLQTGDKIHSVYKNCWTALKTANYINSDINYLYNDLDGFNGKYLTADYMPAKIDIRSIYVKAEYESTWEAIKRLNNVADPYADNLSYYNSATNMIFKSKLDEAAKTQYFDLDSQVQLVVFGHTHLPKLQTYNDKNHIYTNSGTWVDDTKNGSTFVVITPYVENEENKLLVGNYNFNSKDDIACNFKSLTAVLPLTRE
ncbi:MAG: metallophosphoesterase [Treponema sp.]|nr:metallophosphoesterase [Treponema sp.]